MRRRCLILFSLLLCALAGSLTGCATLPLPSPEPPHDEASYTALKPFYLEFCALSEIQKKPGYGADIRGGVGGHSTIYLNGVCLKRGGYPEIAVCPVDPAAHGVGLSVNGHFSNANWVAIPGRNFFYHGDLRPGQALTRRIYDATKAHAKRLGIYDAIRFHNRVFEDMPPGYARDAFKYEISIGTDYAIGYARDRYCARVPVSAAQMAHIVDYLNGLNRPYREGKAKYEWSVLNDNCIHVAHNALSAIGFWPLWPTKRLFLIAAFDFPVPKNEFVNIMRRANDMPLDHLLAVWDDGPARRAVLAGEGLPTRPGAIATFAPVTRDNQVYNTDLQLIFYDDPVFGPYEGWYRRIAAQPRYTDLAADLRHFRSLYGRIEADRRPLSWWLSHHPRLRSAPDFPAFYARYYAAIETSAASIGAAGPLLVTTGH
ncbi:hypothetical protein [Rhodopila sp.]|uniref:hypothetical protein n=1 Tax=Rhodopila sp. TaxID=2480087 RepID=UPI003D0BC9F0